MTRYQASGIGEVVRFDGSDLKKAIRVWDRIEGDLVERAAASPDLSERVALGLWWVVAPSEYGPLLRLARDREGRELERDAALAELEQLRAELAGARNQG